MSKAVAMWQAELIKKGNDIGLAKGHDEERKSNTEAIIRNLMKRNPALTRKEADEDARALLK